MFLRDEIMFRFLLLFLVFFVFSNAQQTVLNSGENKVTLIELYSSQGCSSCPPADEWLSQLKKDKELFKSYIPLAFHVTYWDFLGWKDVFADPLNDARQRNYSQKVWKRNSVYTPQFIVDSKEYKQWFYNQAFPKLQKDKYAGILKATFDENKNIKINYTNKESYNKNVMINIALLGFDLEVDIKSGENDSKLLTHDFVVLEHIQKYGVMRNSELSYESKLYTFKMQKDKKYALVVWISDHNYQQYQAVAGYIK